MLDQAGKVANQPYQAYGGPRIADFSDDQYAGFDMVRDQAAAGSPVMQQGLDYVSDTLSNTGQNPHLNQMIQDSQGDVTRSFMSTQLPGMMSQFQQGGAFGGTAHQQAMQGQQ
jgi:hypothetical protein